MLGEDGGGWLSQTPCPHPLRFSQRIRVRPTDPMGSVASKRRRPPCRGVITPYRKGRRCHVSDCDAPHGCACVCACVKSKGVVDGKHLCAGVLARVVPALTNPAKLG